MPDNGSEGAGEGAGEGALRQPGERRVLSPEEIRAADIEKKHPGAAARAMGKVATMRDVLDVAGKIAHGVALKLYTQFTSETSEHLTRQDFLFRQQLEALAKELADQREQDLTRIAGLEADVTALKGARKPRSATIRAD